MTEPKPGSTRDAELIVGPADLASALRFEAGDVFPAVFATARMVAIMEVAAARVLGPCLAPGEMSVGVSVDIRHTAPTPVGAKVTTTARYLGRDGKLFEFEVVAVDPGGEIGRGLHKRAIVDAARLESGAARRTGSTGG